MPTWSRRRIETVGLAVWGIAAVIPLRFPVEPRGWLLAELGSLGLVLLIAETARKLRARDGRATRFPYGATAVLGSLPVVFAIAARVGGSPIAIEMSTLTTCGAVSLAIAVAALTDRTRSLSLILSGFLVLFCVSISDHRYAAVWPMVWMLGCIWHLIANHWERLDLAMPDAVQRNWTLRPSILISTLLLLALGAYAVKDRMAASQRLGIGLLPTSGGSRWSDPAARSGVGSGDAAIAARDHAESFGAVDSDIFLESTESSLFDMVNDMLGEPKQRNQWERRQAVGHERLIPSHQRSARSEQGAGSFSTERLPPQRHQHFQDAREPSVVQWDGPTGIRLAMQRYDSFDGSQWFQSAKLARQPLTRVDIDDAPWFFDPRLRTFVTDHPDATSVGLLKIIRLDSQRLPVPMLTAGVHIKQVDRQDFFGITDDGSFFMPGRQRVPPLTVVHVASTTLSEDAIRRHLVPSRSEPPRGGPNAAGSLTTADALTSLVRTATAGWTSPYDQLDACLAKLRQEFTFDRAGASSARSLAEFLQTRRGGDHLFATTAALMARELGLSSRLVTGFYVRPNAFDPGAGHASILPRDVHVWAEVQLADGRWFEIEPTPGYRPPSYRPSWALRCRQFAAAAWPLLVGGLLVLAALYRTRGLWIDWGLTAIWSLTGWLRPRQRVRLAIRIIETRARLAGQRRPSGKSQRAWLEQLTLADARLAAAARKFCDAADHLFFGRADDDPLPGATEPIEFELVELLHVSTLIALTQRTPS